MSGPAKSMWILCHGIFGQSHGCKGACCGLLRDFWQSSHRWTTVAMSLSRFGHQTWSRASDFILTIPGCPVCNSNNTRFRSCGGTITRIPHNKQPSSTVISWRLLKYCVISGAVCLSGQPVIVYCNTRDKIGSVCVALRTWSALIMAEIQFVANWWVWLHRLLRLACRCLWANGINNRHSCALQLNGMRCHIDMRQVTMPIFVTLLLLNWEFRFLVLTTWSTACDPWLTEISFHTSIGGISLFRTLCLALPSRFARNFVRFWSKCAKNKRSGALLRTVARAIWLPRLRTARHLCRVLAAISEMHQNRALDNLSFSCLNALSWSSDHFHSTPSFSSSFNGWVMVE